MVYHKGVILPENNTALTTSIGEHLIRKMISVYEGGFTKGEDVIPSGVAMQEKSR